MADLIQASGFFFDLRSTVRHRESANSTRGPHERMRKFASYGRSCTGHPPHQPPGLIDEHAQHFPGQRIVTQRLSRKMVQIERFILSGGRIHPAPKRRFV
ncbi:hypothetical protein AB2N04_11350 [Nitratireductor sp. GISD-1A_MAKvit]|uniref:hypothetical protein n=1 Tax=Nitratireductor sp. GISD-1A_MAKvit TaxID=3234198 RepID=UPI0034669CA4